MVILPNRAIKTNQIVAKKSKQRLLHNPNRGNFTQKMRLPPIKISHTKKQSLKTSKKQKIEIQTTRYWNTGWVRIANHHHLIEGCKKKKEEPNRKLKWKEPFGK